MPSIAPSETLSRFILQSNSIKTSNSTVKYTAFLPYPHVELSVFRISGISDDEIWDIGDRAVAPKRGRQILGRADISALNVTTKDLEVRPNEPPARHANITGWPDEKSKQKEIALELAAEAQLHKKLNTSNHDD